MRGLNGDMNKSTISTEPKKQGSASSGSERTERRARKQIGKHCGNAKRQGRRFALLLEAGERTGGRRGADWATA